MTYVSFAVCAAALCVAAAALPPAAGGEAEVEDAVVVTGPTSVVVVRGGRTALSLDVAGWLEGWKHLGFKGEVDQDGDGSIMRSSAAAGGERVEVEVRATPLGDGVVRLDAAATSDGDVDLQTLVLGVDLGRGFSGGRVTATLADGSAKRMDLPLARGPIGEVREILVEEQGGGGEITLALDPPAPVSFDGALRIEIADALKAGEAAGQSVTLGVAGEAGEAGFLAAPAVVPGAAETPGGWYRFEPSADHDAPSEIAMHDWLDAPAGRHGRVTSDGDRLTYNGRPIKLWGVNNTYAACAPDKATAERRAAFYAKHGINAVRLHKYADGPRWAGIQSDDSFLEFDADALDRMDYFVAKLKERGIYVKLSSTFIVKLGRGDREHVPYLDEFGAFKNDAPHARINTKHGSVFLSKEIQELQIAQLVKLLGHRNPYTGLTYAEDPAVAVVEMFNEDSALFHGTMRQLQDVPTLRERAGREFTAWLAGKYGSEAALTEAWGDRALNSFEAEGLAGESFADGTIVPAGNPWFYDPDQLEGSQAFRKQRLLDAMAFLYEKQNDFYARYLTAIRDAGYAGEVLASNWQAGRAYSHFLNLHGDSLVGMIDRHNYHGGGRGGEIVDAAMVDSPGGSTLSSGLQQVDGRPFMLSEWIHVFPTEWGAEGPALVGAYGMGLQGWDASFIFQNRDQGTYSDAIGGHPWDAAAPQVMGVFPAVSRQVHRGDVAEGEDPSVRNVHVPSLFDGELGFEDQSTQNRDLKEFGGREVPTETLAVRRAVVRFTPSPEPTEAVDPSAHTEDGALVSTTGQLAWKAAGDRPHTGHALIDTPGTQAVVGFGGGLDARLGDVRIAPHGGGFAAIYVSAQNPDETLADGGTALVTAIARARNTGMKIVADRLVDTGEGPVLMEPVRATLTFNRPIDSVEILDHAGARTSRALEVAEGVVEIDTGRDRTPYYLVTFAD